LVKSDHWERCLWSVSGVPEEKGEAKTGCVRWTG